MKKLLVVSSMLALVLAVASPASAHEHDVFQIGDHEYQFVIGSLNEPLTVDDKTGVDFRVADMGKDTGGSMAMVHDDEHATGTPVSGLEKTLKVEISAGNVKKILDLQPAFGTPGAYKAPFIVTVPTTLTYRIFGTLNSIPVDVSFSCISGEVSESTENKTPLKLSESVTRQEQGGGFGCAQKKEDLAFPEAVASNLDIQKKTDQLEAEATANAAKGQAQTLPIVGIALGALGFVMGTIALRKKSSTTV